MDGWLQCCFCLLHHLQILLWLQTRAGTSSTQMEPLILCSILLLLLFQGKFTLLRDARTDGSFLVHHFLSFYLRGTRAAGLCEAKACLRLVLGASLPEQ